MDFDVIDRIVITKPDANAIHHMQREGGIASGEGLRWYNRAQFYRGMEKLQEYGLVRRESAPRAHAAEHLFLLTKKGEKFAAILESF